MEYFYMASLSHNSVYPPRFIFESIILGKRGGGGGQAQEVRKNYVLGKEICCSLNLKFYCCVMV